MAQVSIAAIAVACGILTGCTGSSGGGSAVKGSSPEVLAISPTDDWGSHGNIASLFQANCAHCHEAAWASCEDDHTNAKSLSRVISTNAMPRDHALATADKATMLAWLDDGAPCAGQ